MRNRGLEGPPHSGEVNVDHGLPLLVRHFPEPAPVADPGVGDDDVKSAAELGDTVGEHGHQRARVADVGLPGVDWLVLGFNQTYGLVKILRCRGRVDVGRRHRAGDVHRNDLRTFAGEPHRVAAALTASRAGDESDLAVQ